MPVARPYRDSPFYAGTQTDKDVAAEQTRRELPWTTAELEKVRDAALALVRTHQSIDLPFKKRVPTFDGRALWDLLGALDRTYRAPDVDDPLS